MVVLRLVFRQRRRNNAHKTMHPTPPHPITPGTILSYAKDSHAADEEQRVADFNHFVIFDTQVCVAAAAAATATCVHLCTWILDPAPHPNPGSGCSCHMPT